MAEATVETRQSWIVAVAALGIMSVSFGAPLIAVVALKPIAAELGSARSVPSAAYSLAWFGTALGGVNTPETQQADDDLAVGRLVQAVSQSRYAADTLIIITEDDCQDGPDHVDSHRATAYVVGPYVKQGAVVSTRYSQVNMLRTIEDLYGLTPLGTAARRASLPLW